MFATPSPPSDSGFANSETHRVHSEKATQHQNSPVTPPFTAASQPRRRSSAFFEAGLQGEDAFVDAKVRRDSRPRIVRFRSKVEVVEPEAVDLSPYTVEKMPPYFPTLPRILFFAFVIAIVLPSLGNSPLLKAGIGPIGATAVPVAIPVERTYKTLQSRQDTSTDVCKRWSQQSAVVNGTLYLYGGRSTTSADQTSDTWNNDLLTLDLTNSWQISSPSLKGLPQPNGPPAVSLGFLWNSYDALYLYGGEFSENPSTAPTTFSTWSYNIDSGSWSESSSPVTVQGASSGPGNEPVQRAAEGAGVTIPNLGRGFYFGGHLDEYTTEGWSNQIARVYLTSLLEYTFPGYSNPAVDNGQAAGSDGIYRNITEGGTQDTNGFPERADGILVYVPGYSKSGIILGLAGGTNATFTQMNVIDVYDVESSTWYKQSTSGPTPEIRVNPCAVALSAADGSSTQIYMYGGQNLIPYGEQTQYDDMWILTVPSFTWIKVDTTDQSVPPARAGHTCNVWNSQMVVVGGYVGQDLSCEVPGVYVFNTSSLTWQNDYIALGGTEDDKLNRQKAQRKDTAALQGSYGYVVPEKVQSVIGGNGVGSATVTAPAQTPLGGPMATGSPITYTVTGSDGAVVTETSAPTTQDGSSQTSNDGPNVAAIVAGVLAAVLGLLAIYLGFCAWIYRRQLKLYKNHVALAQQQSLTSGGNTYLPVPVGGKKISEKSQNSSSLQRTSGESRSNQSRGNASRTSGQNATAYPPMPGTEGVHTANSSTEDLLQGQEPSFLGVFLNPRRSLRVVNRD